MPFECYNYFSFYSRLMAIFKILVDFFLHGIQKWSVRSIEQRTAVGLHDANARYIAKIWCFSAMNYLKFVVIFAHFLSHSLNYVLSMIAVLPIHFYHSKKKKIKWKLSVMHSFKNWLSLLKEPADQSINMMILISAFSQLKYDFHFFVSLFGLYQWVNNWRC